MISTYPLSDSTLQSDDIVAGHCVVLDFFCKRLHDLDDEEDQKLLRDRAPAIVLQSLRILAINGLPRERHWVIRCQLIRILHGLVIIFGFQSTL